MEKINFKDLPNTETPLNAENLNLLQSNIESWLAGIKAPNVDLNNYKTTGVYYFTTGCTNAPRNYLYCLVIGKAGEPVMQIGISMNTVMYFRTFANNIWSEWRQVTSTVVS